jgi:hypothetical protein
MHSAAASTDSDTATTATTATATATTATTATRHRHHRHHRPLRQDAVRLPQALVPPVPAGLLLPVRRVALPPPPAQRSAAVRLQAYGH